MVNRIVDRVKEVEQLEEDQEFYYMWVKMRQVLTRLKPRHKKKDEVSGLIQKVNTWINICESIGGDNSVQTVARRRNIAFTIYYDEGARDIMDSWTDPLWNGGYFSNKGYDTYDSDEMDAELKELEYQH